MNQTWGFGVGEGVVGLHSDVSSRVGHGSPDPSCTRETLRDRMAVFEEVTHSLQLCHREISQFTGHTYTLQA